MKRLAIKIAYLGDGFSGSQVQPGLRTVEGDVLEDLQLITGLDRDALGLRFSSRTDKGVNALGNAMALSTDMDGRTLLKALNSVSDRVFYRSWCEVDPDFNVRHASSRSYRYILPARGLDPISASECASLFMGEHDFVRFCRPDGKPTVLTVDRAEARIEGDRMVLVFDARYFLWNMIRRMAAAIESVASGRSSVGDVEDALNGADITFGMARPDALTLMDVRYDWLRFQDAEKGPYSDRKEDGAFTNDLRRSFFESL